MEAENGRREGTFLAEHNYDVRLTDVIRGDLSREPGDFADNACEAAASGVWAGIH
jgi:hypothetical protein